jgi:hypothetical protein
LIPGALDIFKEVIAISKKCAEELRIRKDPDRV